MVILKSLSDYSNISVISNLTGSSLVLLIDLSLGNRLFFSLSQLIFVSCNFLLNAGH